MLVQLVSRSVFEQILENIESMKPNLGIAMEK